MNTDCHLDINDLVENIYALNDSFSPLDLDPPLQYGFGHRIPGKPAYCAYCNSPDHNRASCDAPEELRVSYYMDKVLSEYSP